MNDNRDKMNDIGNILEMAAVAAMSDAERNALNAKNLAVIISQMRDTVEKVFDIVVPASNSELGEWFMDIHVQLEKLVHNSADMKALAAMDPIAIMKVTAMAKIFSDHVMQLEAMLKTLLLVRDIKGKENAGKH